MVERDVYRIVPHAIISMNAVSSQRTYTLKVRAERQRQTRERIVAAAEALHREVGPARTTIAEIARRAGVERLTVYNHFPLVTHLLGACQAHFLTRHPPPDLSPAGATEDNALERLETTLEHLYHWYRANAAMEQNIHRDRDLLPELDALLRKTVDPVFDRAAREYAALIATKASSTDGVRSMIRLALDFRTWRLVTRGATPDRVLARLLARAIASAR